MRCSRFWFGISLSVLADARIALVALIVASAAPSPARPGPPRSWPGAATLSARSQTSHRGPISQRSRRGSATGYALKSDGSIVAWGDDTYGEVSNVPSGTGFTAIAAGLYTGYALKSDGSIVAWGFDTYGEVSDVPSGTDFTAIAGGQSNGFALKTDGSIVAWGYNGYSLVSNVPSGTDFTAIAAGLYNGYAAQDRWFGRGLGSRHRRRGLQRPGGQRFHSDRGRGIRRLRAASHPRTGIGGTAGTGRAGPACARRRK